MLNKYYLLLLAFVISCMPHKPTSDFLGNGMYSLDSIRFSRIGKPDWLDRGDYPKEELTISFNDGQFKIHRADSLLTSGVFKREEIAIAKGKLDTIKIRDLDKIYNADAHWDVELELFLFCKEDSKIFIIKSYGQHGKNPREVADLYSFLLRFMVKEIIKLD